MKTIGFHTLYPELSKNNFLFENTQAFIGDDLLKPFVELKNYANQQGFDASLVDDVDEVETVAYVFIDMPDKKNKYFKMATRSGKPIFLLALESKLIKPNSFVKANHKKFNAVFTWDDSMVDDIKYFKINYSFDFPTDIEFNIKRNKLCTLIAGNKYSRHPDELYSKRLEAIRWFEENHLADFDLYGTNWDRSTFFGSRWLGLFNRLDSTRKLFSPRFPSYKGRIDRKKSILEKYKFAICYENASGHSGYITEKIFDCFFAGCIPIYLGADNISKYIPGKTFLNKRNFNSYEDLYSYISKIDEDEYLEYLANIKTFLLSQESVQFSNKKFAATIVDKITSYL
jgi:hypothetical protein